MNYTSGFSIIRLISLLKLDSMRWFSHRHRSGRWHNCITYLSALRTAPKQNATLFRSYPQWPWPLNLIFKLWWNFCTMHLITKFHHPTFNHSEVTVLTNRQTNRHRWKHPPRSAMLRRWVNIFWLSSSFRTVSMNSELTVSDLMFHASRFSLLVLFCYFLCAWFHTAD